jgi:hypothetical protein
MIQEVNSRLFSQELSHLSDFLVGKAGEYIVCADLLLKGYNAFPIEHNLPYDIVLNIGDKMYRVQVKTTRDARFVFKDKGKTPSYCFSLSNKGYARKKKYTAEDVDFYALVALDTKEVGYYPFCERSGTLYFRCPKFKGKYWDEKWLEIAPKINDFKSQGLSTKEIAAKLDMNIAALYGYFHSKRRPNWGAKGLYFDELTLERCLDIVKDGSFKNKKVLRHYKSLVKEPFIPTPSNHYGSKIFVEYNGERLSLRDACQKVGIKRTVVYQRMTKYGQSFDEAISKPIRVKA